MVSLRWMYDGVDPDIAGNGGPECAAYVPACRRLWESLLICVLGAAYCWWGWRRAFAPSRPTHNQVANKPLPDSPNLVMGKKVLLMLMCLVLGCEIGFKCATKTLIYMLNPCHLVTIVQIFLLVAPPSPLVTVLFRWQMHSLNGAVLAIIFPVVNTRLLPFETELYYVQHIMMLIIPFYLLKAGGVYSMERLGDFSWPILTAGSWLLYHFFPLQLIGLLTQVNLNNMLCPAISDPFCGPNYRIWATGHQSFLIGMLGKLYYVVTCVILWLLGSGLGTGASAAATRPPLASHDGAWSGCCCTCGGATPTAAVTSNGSAVVIGNGVGHHRHYGNGDLPKSNRVTNGDHNGIKVE